MGLLTFAQKRIMFPFSGIGACYTWKTIGDQLLSAITGHVFSRKAVCSSYVDKPGSKTSIDR